MNRYTNRNMNLNKHKRDIVSSDFRNSFLLKAAGAFVFVALLASNIVIFAKSMHLSDQMTHLESETRELRKESTQLEQKMYSESSLENLSTLAEHLGFTKSAEPIYLETNEYALAQ